ncbi:MAG TPA: hypothetical protein VMB85_25100 [Bryobacteraceae bacterium]|nr:hypothetical protein [Bryobacteraceae bacterium]
MSLQPQVDHQRDRRQQMKDAVQRVRRDAIASSQTLTNGECSPNPIQTKKQITDFLQKS